MASLVTTRVSQQAPNSESPLDPSNPNMHQLLGPAGEGLESECAKQCVVVLVVLLLTGQVQVWVGAPTGRDEGVEGDSIQPTRVVPGAGEGAAASKVRPCRKRRFSTAPPSSAQRSAAQRSNIPVITVHGIS